MRVLLALGILLPSTGLSVLHGQTDYYARLGVTLATNLLRDVLFQEIRVRQSLAPTLAVGVSLPLAPTYGVGLEGSLASSGYHSTEGGVQTDLGTLRTGSIMLNLVGLIRSRIRWRGGLGVIHYWPADDQGIFLQGGPTRFLAGAGLDYRHPMGTRWDLMLSLRYDFHRFTTDELKARGFSGSQGVQRVSASVGLARGRR
jgi:hypothetical protein